MHINGAKDRKARVTEFYSTSLPELITSSVNLISNQQACSSGRM